MKGRNWYNLSVEGAFKQVDSSPLGLSSDEAHRRLEVYGPNELQEAERASPIRIFLSQFLSLLVVILIVAASISAAIGILNDSREELIDAAVIMIIVVLNAVFGFVQEFKAEKAIEALRALTAPQASVIREGERMSLPSAEIVPGDVILLESGDKIPADARLVEVASLRVNEASLTGESVPISKSLDPLRGEVYVGDRTNMVFRGCTVEAGRVRMIAGLVQEEEAAETPLQKRLARLALQHGLSDGCPRAQAYMGPDALQCGDPRDRGPVGVQKLWKP